ncbi:hypothetical protein CRUP_011410 [Coryphaenoides rupestris]|nr:hypothetical protein CRUP_011410 [Coryphaenoides rupestris]
MMTGGVTGGQLGVAVWLCVSALGLLHGGALGGKVLVVPVQGSHWLSMKLLVHELIARGHDVVLVEPEASMVSIQESVGYRAERYPVSYTMEELFDTLKELTDNLFLKQPKITDMFINMQRLVNFTSIHVRGCESLLYNREVMGRLRAAGFDALLTDPFLPCGTILAETLAVPAVYFLRGLPCGLDESATQCPAPPSFVPRSYSGNTATMTFPQRVKNVIMYAVEAATCRIIYARFDELASRFLERDVTFLELTSHGAVWLLRYDFAFLSPRPQMPNMILIGGVNCARPAPLPAVVWRYSGVLPDNVPENVRMMKWLPQNDLLGSHGIYEGICHAVPMVMMPLFGDQPDNVDNVVARGVATMVNVFDVTTESLLDALNKVIHDRSYKDNIVKLSAVHRDRPIEPLDLAVFWTEFVMRHKGADHLRPAAQDLNWIQYHSLDTIGFLAAILMTVAFLSLKCCLFCCRKCGTRLTAKKKKE